MVDLSDQRREHIDKHTSRIAKAKVALVRVAGAMERWVVPAAAAERYEEKRGIRRLDGDEQCDDGAMYDCRRTFVKALAVSRYST